MAPAAKHDKKRHFKRDFKQEREVEREEKREPFVEADEETRTVYATEDSPLNGKKVLLVDDDFDVLQTLQAAFEPTGCTIFTSRNGNKAVDVAQREKIDLMILDMMLPGRSGFLVLEKLKGDRLPSEKPYIIMLTGNEGLRHRQYAEARGVNDYFTKPASLEKILNRAEELVRDPEA